MGLLKEFRDFAMRGNVVDMAVGVIIGTAFGKIVSTLVEKVLMPPIGYLSNGVDFKDKAFTLVRAGEMGAKSDVVVGWGELVNTIINFIIVAFCLFIVVKAMNTARKKEAASPAPPPAPTRDQQLLTEIRDLLARR